jgi:hypothetical protein
MVEQNTSPPHHHEGQSCKTINDLAALILAPARLSVEKRQLLQVLTTAVSMEPEVADAALVEMLIKATDCSNERSRSVRHDALGTISMIARVRPELVDSMLVEQVTKVAKQDVHNDVRQDAQETLVIVEQQLKSASSAERPHTVSALLCYPCTLIAYLIEQLASVLFRFVFLSYLAIHI